MSLKEPRQKMSKSHSDPKSRILITDSADEIRAKIKEALTDSTEGISYSPDMRPGVSNLLEIFKHARNSQLLCDELARDFSGVSMRGFKDAVSQAVISCLSGIREKYLDLMDPGSRIIDEALDAGHAQASKLAAATMRRVRQKVGIPRLGKRFDHEGKPG